MLTVIWQFHNCDCKFSLISQLRSISPRRKISTFSAATNFQTTSKFKILPRIRFQKLDFFALKYFQLNLFGSQVHLPHACTKLELALSFSKDKCINQSMISLGGRQITEVAFTLLTQPSRVRFSHLTAVEKNRVPILLREPANLKFVRCQRTRRKNRKKKKSMSSQVKMTVHAKIGTRI